MPISCPESATACICSGNVSIEWPGMNHVVLIPNRSNSSSRRGEPTPPAHNPAAKLSLGEHFFVLGLLGKEFANGFWLKVFQLHQALPIGQSGMPYKVKRE